MNHGFCLSNGPCSLLLSSMYDRKYSAYFKRAGCCVIPNISLNSYHHKNQNKKNSIGVDDRRRRNCSGNIINDITYRKRLREYKTYLIKSGVLKTYIENIKNISKAFCKRATTRN